MKKARIKPRSKIWIEVDGVYLMGDGRANLLSAIDRFGSISEAARQLGISYRHAWGYIKKIEERLGIKIVDTIKGGKGGGCAKLTRRGKSFLTRYQRFRKSLKKEIKEHFAKHF